MAQTTFSVEKIRGASGGFAKGNRYNVNIIPPNFLQTAGAVVSEKLQYLCESVSLPTKGIASNAQKVYGPPREIPYGETFTEAALSFILDDAFTVKRFFDRWQAHIINTESGNVANYWNDIIGTINITRLSNDATDFITSSTQYKVKLLEAYPSAVGEVALGHSMGNEVLKLNVTFKYRRWNRL